MHTAVFAFLAMFGLALAGLLLIANRFQWRSTAALRKASGIVATLVGVGLVSAVVIAYFFGAGQVVDSLQNSLLNIELTLRHWFHSLSLG
jgi:hypothetical protein